MLQKSSFEELVKFSWTALVDKIKGVSPIFYIFMKGCTIVRHKNDKQKKTYHMSEDVVFGICVCV